MNRKIHLSTVTIFVLGVACVITIAILKLIFGFYFGPERMDLKYPSLEIQNKRSYKNTIPNWCYAGKEGYKLVFAVNTPEPGESYSREENPLGGRVPMMVAVLDPFKKEMHQVENNIYRDNLDDGKSTVSLSNGKRYATLKLGNGVLVYEEGEQFINYCVYYMFNNRAEPILPSYGNPYLTYVSKAGLLKKPIINIHPLAGGMFSGGGFMQGKPEQNKTISLPVGSIVGWIGDSELIFSSTRLNKKFQYVNMNDLWRISVYGGQPNKLCDNAYSPLFYMNESTVIFLRKEKSDVYSLWKLSLSGINHEEKLIEFNYTSSDNQLPAIAIANDKQNQNFDICYTADSKNGKKSILIVNSQNRSTRVLVKDQNVRGPIITSTNVDAGEGKYILYFADEDAKTKAYVIDSQGKVQSEIFDLLKAAPSEAYVKMESK